MVLEETNQRRYINNWNIIHGWWKLLLTSVFFVFLLKQQLKEYKIDAKEVVIFRDNNIVIAITQNHVLHVDIRHHFIRDHVKNKDEDGEDPH